jgi:tetratricopeptide (TPR) repeat protein
VRSALAGALVVAALLALWGSQRALERGAEGRSPGQHLLYLPSGRLLKVLSLGFDPLLADIIYLWSIQYYGHYRGGERYDHLIQIYEHVITELDPQFRDAYHLGSLILSLEARRPGDALRLLDKGVRENPEDWMLPFEAGFIAYHNLRDYERAAAYFQTSMDRPGAHPVVRRFYADMFQRMGDRATSLELWSEVRDTAQDEYVRRVAEKHVHDLTLEVHLEVLRAAVEAFRGANGRLPAELRQLVDAGLLSAIPVDPDGRPYVYDPGTGELSARSGFVLPSRPGGGR